MKQMHLSNYQFYWYHKQILDLKDGNAVECKNFTMSTTWCKKQMWINWKIHYVLQRMIFIGKFYVESSTERFNTFLIG